MVGKLLPTAWPSGNGVVYSIRQARSKTNPPVYSGSAKMVVIPQGTYHNGTHWSITFLCRGCITGSSLSFNAGATSARLGWGMSTSSVSNAGSPTARLGAHRSGTGTFNIDLASAKNPKFSQWAQMAIG